MKSISCFKDLARYGIEPMTREACGLTYRILFDLTAHGQKIVEKYLGCTITSEPWGRGTPEERHVASVMLSQELVIPIGIFALLESECRAVWLLDNRRLFGLEAADDEEAAAKSLTSRSIRSCARLPLRRFRR